MEYKVQVLHEEKRIQDVKVFHVETPERVTVKVKYTIPMLEELESKVRKQIEEGLKHWPVIYESVWGRMQRSIMMPKDTPMDPEFLGVLPDLLDAISITVFEDQGWDKIKAKQAKLPAKPKE